jgi:hypothetical protein
VKALRPSKKTVQAVIDRDRGCCAWCGHEVHGVRGFDWSVGHRRPAGFGGDRRPETHAAGNLVVLHGHGTAGCHGEIESSRTAAQARGFFVPKESPEEPEMWSIEHALYGWCYLRNDGSIATDPPEVTAACAS